MKSNWNRFYKGKKSNRLVNTSLPWLTIEIVIASKDSEVPTNNNSIKPRNLENKKINMAPIIGTDILRYMLA